MDATQPTPSPPLSFTIAPALAATYDVTVIDLLRAHGCIELVVTSAVIHQPSLSSSSSSPSPSPPRLLLIQRAAHDAYPNVWETPGGSADPLPGVRVVAEAARELWEETGLRATAATALVDSHTWMIDGDAARVCLKLAFLFEVEQGGDADGELGVVLNPDEHQSFVWVTEEEARMNRCGNVDIIWSFHNQKDLALAAFDVQRQQQQQNKY